MGGMAWPDKVAKNGIVLGFHTPSRRTRAPPPVRGLGGLGVAFKQNLIRYDEGKKERAALPESLTEQYPMITMAFPFQSMELSSAGHFRRLHYSTALHCISCV